MTTKYKDSNTAPIRRTIAIGPFDGEGKFGRNTDIDTGTDPEDVIDQGGMQYWPTSSGVLTITSSSAQDTAGGRGARVLKMTTISESFIEAEHTINLNGTADVTTDISAATLRGLNVQRGYITTSGTANTNVGNITISHGSTTVAQISSGFGQTLKAAMIVPAVTLAGYTVTKARLASWKASLTKAQNITVGLTFFQRPNGGSWRVVDADGINNNSRIDNEYDNYESSFSPGTQLRVEATQVSANDADVRSRFSLRYE